MRGWILAAVGLIMIAVAMPPARASAYAMTSGDTIYTDASERCTLGYVWNVAGRVYGLSAGHCAAAVGGTVQDLSVPTRGVWQSVHHTPDYDYATIDFGHAAAVPMVTPGGQEMNHVRQARPGPVCHFGETSGVECGQVIDTDGPDDQGRFRTSGMHGARGDSGGPVWQLAGSDSAYLVGIWSGDIYDDTDHPLGVFLDITKVFPGAAT